MERERHVVAMDLPGFAHSERGNRPYSPELMADAIAAVLDDIGSPTHVVALSLASEFAARAASIRPDLVASLTFISPTGMGRRTRTESKADGWSEIALANALLGQGIFDLLATLPSIDYFLSKSFAGDVDAGLRAFAKLSAEQPEARHAPLAFLKGGLFTPDAMNRLYQPLAVPTLVLYDQDAYTDFANLPEFVSSGGGRRSASRVPNTRGLPQFDDTLSTASAIDGFWNGIEDR
jgi:pimeloyl-ACP methyl ester carboxylesterase